MDVRLNLGFPLESTYSDLAGVFVTEGATVGQGAWLGTVGTAHLARISRRRIEQIESGIATTTTPDTAPALGSALGCPVNDLIEVVDGD